MTGSAKRKLLRRFEKNQLEVPMIRAILVGMALFSLAACETAKGAGKDIESAGDAIQQAASDVQESL